MPASQLQARLEKGIKSAHRAADTPCRVGLTATAIPSMSNHASDFSTLDAERMDMLRDLCTDAGPEMLLEMLGSWKSEARRYLDTARSALSAADTGALKTTAHSLKGSCGNMGIVRLAELSRLLEAASGTSAEAVEILDAMEEEFARACEQLAKIAG